MGKPPLPLITLNKGSTPIFVYASKKIVVKYGDHFVPITAQNKIRCNRRHNLMYIDFYTTLEECW